MQEKKNKYNASQVLLYPSGLVKKGYSRAEIAEKKRNGLIPGDVIIFDSELEALYYRDEILPHLGTTIKNVTLQPKYTLIPTFEKQGKKYQAMTYSPDFLVEYTDGRTVAIDVKGMETDRFVVKKKLFDFMYIDVELLVMKRVLKFGGWVTTDEYKRLKAKERKESKSTIKAASPTRIKKRW